MSYILYQVFFHPLAKYPGPFLAKLTNFYSVYHAAKGDRHFDLYELHLKHGPIVRWGPSHLSFCSVSALETVYGHNANVQKGSWYQVTYGHSIFNVVDKAIHARKKRVMSQAFSDKAIRGMEPHILSAIRVWSENLGNDNTPSKDLSKIDSIGENSWTAPKDMSDHAAYMIFDVLGEICFGETFGTAINTANRYFLELMKDHISLINTLGQAPILHQFNLVDLFMRNKKELRKKQLVFSRQQLQKRLAMGTTSNRKDIIYYLQEAKDPETGEGYSQAELMYETTLLLGAGAETANTTLSSIFYFLVKHPDVLQRLTDTIRDAFPDVESIASGPVLNSMVFLRACIDECLRICPPVPMPLPREVLAGGIVIDGHYVPQGCTVGVPTYTLHHDEDYFDNPFEYNPNRWLVHGTHGVFDGEGRTAGQVAKARQAFAPFSVGPRACIGRSVALLELYIGVARTIWLYDIRMAPGSENVGVGRGGEYKTEDHFVVHKQGPILQFRKAKH